MTAVKKTAAKKAPAVKPASNCMCKADLVSLVTALIVSRGNLPTAAALETAKHIVETAHESA